MADDLHLKPPWWLKPMNKVFMFMLRLGLPISGKEGPLLLTAGRASETIRMVELSAEDARPLLRQFPTLVPTGVGFMKRSGLVTTERPTNSRRWRGVARSSGSTRHSSTGVAPL
jgi:hypothetical protein